MKTNFTTDRKSEIRNSVPKRLLITDHCLRITVYCLLITACCLTPLRAVLPEPDNVVYGQIAISTNLVTAQRTNVVVEVRPSGDTNVVSPNVLASYRMGQNPNLGDLYAVEIPFWSKEDAINPLPSPAGSNLVILVKETVVIPRRSTNIYLRYQTNFVVGDRGYVQQINFGAVPATTLTGFDAWAAAWGVGAGGLDPDGDGVSNYGEYLAGTDPKDASKAFRLSVTASNDQAMVSFSTLAASGTGYEGQQRYYVLESTFDPLAQTNAWTAVPGYNNIIGSGQNVTYTLPATNSSPAFYRGRVELRKL